ncbi:unnamed protein product [Scytosiphon promiscuus]
MESSFPDPHEAQSQGDLSLQPEVTASVVPDAPRPGTSVSEESAELYFLIANFLTNASPCSRAAAVLQQELRERNLLGTAFDWQSNARSASFEDVRQRHQALPANQLARVTAQYLRQQQAGAAAGNNDGGGGGGAGADAVGSSSGTAIVVRDQATPSTGPGLARSLLSKVEPFGYDREANEKARAACAVRVIEACVQAMRVQATARKVSGDLASVRRKLEAAESEAREEALAIELALEREGGSATRGRCRAALVPGQESQAELTRRLALKRQLEELLARESVLPEEATLAQEEKDVAIKEARRRGALRDSLTRYAGKAVPTILSNRRAGGGRFRGRVAGRVPLASTSARLLDDRMRPLVTVNGHGINPVFCIKFDRTGQYVFTGADDGLVKVWSTSSGRLLLCLRGHASVITDMDVSPDNSLLVTSSDDRNMRVWDPRTGATLAVLRGHNRAVNLVRFAPGDSVAMSASEDGTCRVWDLRDQDSEDVVPIVLPHTNEQGGMIPVMCLHNTRRTGRDTIGHGEVIGEPMGANAFPAGGAGAGVLASGAFAGGPGDLVGSAGSGEVFAPWGGVPVGGAPGASTGGASSGQGPVIGAVQAPGGTPPPLSAWRRSCSVSFWRGRGVGPWFAYFRLVGRSGSRVVSHPRSEFGALRRREKKERRVAQVRQGMRPGKEHVSQYTDCPRDARRLLGRRLSSVAKGSHVSGVTDARFSGLGDRILTASMEDGTARIYSWGPRFSNVKHVVLKRFCSFETADTNQTRHTREGGVPGAPRRCLLVHAASWRCDDEVVVTTEKAPVPSAAASRALEDVDTGSTFKVWNSETGALLHTIKSAHAQTVSALIPHPFDSDSLASVGGEGTNILAAGPQSDQIHHGDSVAVLDGVFSPDGNSIAVADSLGRWTLYGTGQRTDETVAGKKVPLEQYFTSDYRELVRDQRQHVVDAFTQQPPHLAQTGDLVDFIGNAHPEDVQPRKVWAAVSRRAGGCVWGGAGRSRGPTWLRAKSHRRSSSAEEPITRAANAPRGAGGEVAKREMRRFRSGESMPASDGKGHALRGAQGPAATASGPGLAAPARRSGDRGGPGQGPRRQGSQDERPRLRGFYTDPGEDEIYLELPVVPDEFNTAVAAADSDEEVDRGGLECALCHNGHSREYPLPGRVVGANPLMDGASQLWVHDGCALYSPMVCRDDGSDALCNVTSEKDELHGVQAPGGDDRVPGGVVQELYWTDPVPADRVWLTLDDPVKAMQHGYCPQVGEVVMYFPQGHETYLRTFPENNTPPYKLFKGRPAVVRCQVKEISFAFPTDHAEVGNQSVVCRLSLEVLGFPVRVSSSVVTRTTIALASRGEYPLAYREDSLRDCGEADYLVSERRYNESVRRAWKPSERAYFGVVVKLERDQSGSEHWPNSPWGCLHIKWDMDGSTNSLGPWEPRPVTWDESRDPPPVDPATLRACIPRELRDRLAAAVRGVAESPQAELFVEPVDVPDYHMAIPVPMDLGLILRRLEKDYYCSVEALEFDCNLVYANCAKYNEPGSVIVGVALAVSDQLVQAIKAISEPGGISAPMFGRPRQASGSAGSASGNDRGRGEGDTTPASERMCFLFFTSSLSCLPSLRTRSDEVVGRERVLSFCARGNLQRPSLLPSTAMHTKQNTYMILCSRGASAAVPVRESDRRRKSTSKASFSYASGNGRTAPPGDQEEITGQPDQQHARTPGGRSVEPRQAGHDPAPGAGEVAGAASAGGGQPGRRGGAPPGLPRRHRRGWLVRGAGVRVRRPRLHRRDPAADGPGHDEVAGREARLPLGVGAPGRPAAGGGELPVVQLARYDVRGGGD